MESVVAKGDEDTDFPKGILCVFVAIEISGRPRCVALDVGIH